MKLKILLGILVTMSCLVGCSGGDKDGPQLSDDDLLKRGQAGHNAAGSAPKGGAGMPDRGATPPPPGR